MKAKPARFAPARGGAVRVSRPDCPMTATRGPFQKAPHASPACGDAETTRADQQSRESKIPSWI